MTLAMTVFVLLMVLTSLFKVDTLTMAGLTLVATHTSSRDQAFGMKWLWQFEPPTLCGLLVPIFLVS